MHFLRYSRLLLRTFTVSIAAVWLVGGLNIAWRDKGVDLPVSSEDVIYTFPIESKYIAFGGVGSFGDGGRKTLCPPNSFPTTKATLVQVSGHQPDTLWFKFTNTTGCGVYMVYEPVKTNSKDAFFPYGMVCPDRLGRMHQVVDRDTAPEMRVLAADDYFFFSASDPISKGPCKIKVGYHRDPRAYELFKAGARYSDLDPENQSIINESIQSVELTIRPDRR